MAPGRRRRQPWQGTQSHSRCGEVTITRADGSVETQLALPERAFHLRYAGSCSGCRGFMDKGTVARYQSGCLMCENCAGP